MKKSRIKDKAWRMKSLYKIKDKDMELVYFRRNKAQTDFRERCTNRNLMLKSRQLGFTTDEAMDNLDEALFTPNFDALIIAHEKDEALKIFDKKVELAWKNIDDRLKKYWRLLAARANTLKFAHDRDGKVTSSIEVAQSGRSGTYHRVHISEFAKICAKYPKRAEEIITGTIPSVPMKGRLDIESTAEGDIGAFHDMFWDAWNRQGGKNYDPKTMTKEPMEFAAFFYNWQWDEAEIATIKEATTVPREFKEYQKKHNLTDIEISYYYQKFLALGKKWARLKQEYPTTPEEAFQGSGDRLFDSEKVMEAIQEYEEREEVGDWIWLRPYNNRHAYAMGADVAEGVGGDSCAAVVWDFTDDEVVAIYANNKIAPDAFAYMLRTAGNRYGTCLIAPERNNHGHATISKLKEIYDPDKIFRQINEEGLHKKKTERFGWLTTLASKPKMMFGLVDAVNEGEVKIPRELGHEARLYGRESLNVLKADPDMTNHFDLLIAAAIGWQMRNYIENFGDESESPADKIAADEEHEAMLNDDEVDEA